MECLILVYWYAIALRKQTGTVFALFYMAAGTCSKVKCGKRHSIRDQLPLKSKKNRNPNGTKKKNPKRTSDNKTEKPLVFFAKTENQMLKNEKPETAMNTKTKKPKSFCIKTEKPI